MYRGEAACVCVPGHTNCLEGVFIRKGHNDAVVSISGVEYLYPVDWVVPKAQGCNHAAPHPLSAENVAEIEVCVCVPGSAQCIEGVIVQRGVNDTIVRVGNEETLFPSIWIRLRADGCAQVDAAKPRQTGSRAKRKSDK